MWQVLERNGVVPLLQNSLKCGRLPNAYLLVGPAHVGKMTLALNLAQALNCEAMAKPCGECSTCRKIATGKHADVQTIGLNNGGASDTKTKEISIEQVRGIQHSASLPPYEGKFKTFIIDGAEHLSIEAANCLLKTLEEPAEKVIYILLTTNDRLLPLTVISRCQRLELRPLPAEDIEKNIAAKNNLDAKTAKLVSRLAHGCLGWAVALAQNANVINERTTKIERLLEITGSGVGERFAYAGRKLANLFNHDRQTVQDELGLWLDWWRDILLVKTGNREKITNVDFTAKLDELAAEYELRQIREVISRIQEAALHLKQNASPRLVFEVLMLNIPRRINIHG